MPDAPRVLHFAPEAALGSFIREGAVEYVTADLMRDDVDLKINIEDIDLPDASFEVIVCNHVLEHVNTPLALTELYRILVPGGTALLSFPIEEGMAETYRNPEVTTDFERLLHFGQRDHVLSFGTDIREMIRGAGFGLSEFATPPERHVDMGLALGSRIFIAKKAA
ncbi:MAG: methyltransferase domain-containing protein [Pseudomonadota bacterium]